ncbi:MAG: hypothetical protein M1378_01750 [Bacteroidetes bacterium]|nr:hypothetical protein [Bacteroidota bacterium]
MRERLLRQFGPLSPSLFVVLALVVQGRFSVRLVLPHDEETYKAVTGLRKDIMVFMTDQQLMPGIGLIMSLNAKNADLGAVPDMVKQSAGICIALTSRETV